jgi:hypothetical protein
MHTTPTHPHARTQTPTTSRNTPYMPSPPPLPPTRPPQHVNMTCGEKKAFSFSSHIPPPQARAQALARKNTSTARTHTHTRTPPAHAHRHTRIYTRYLGTNLGTLVTARVKANVFELGLLLNLLIPANPHPHPHPHQHPHPHTHERTWA